MRLQQPNADQDRVFFFRLNGHHLLHHRYMRKNFNVVLPLADLCLGTLLLRSKVCFAQATGATVPNVQPRNIVPCTNGDGAVALNTGKVVLPSYGRYEGHQPEIS